MFGRSTGSRSPGRGFGSPQPGGHSNRSMRSPQPGGHSSRSMRSVQEDYSQHTYRDVQRDLQGALKKEQRAKDRVDFLERAMVANETAPTKSRFGAGEDADADYYLYRERLNAARHRMQACEDSLKLAIDRGKFQDNEGGGWAEKTKKLEDRVIEAKKNLGTNFCFLRNIHNFKSCRLCLGLDSRQVFVPKSFKSFAKSTLFRQISK